MVPSNRKQNRTNWTIGAGHLESCLPAPRGLSEVYYARHLLWCYDMNWSPRLPRHLYTTYVQMTAMMFPWIDTDGIVRLRTLWCTVGWRLPSRPMLAAKRTAASIIFNSTLSMLSWIVRWHTAHYRSADAMMSSCYGMIDDREMGKALK